jgi:hypothetical protein
MYSNFVRSGKLPSTSETYFIPKEMMDDALTVLRTVSTETLDYLQDTRGKDLTVMRSFKEGLLSKVAPLRTTGDGNCLLHALSRALWGKEVYHEILRKCVYRVPNSPFLRLLQAELEQHEEFYKHAVDKPPESKDPQAKKEEEFCYTDADYKEFVFQAGQLRECLGFIHVFALANIIKRPIIVYASEKDMNDWGVHEVCYFFWVASSYSAIARYCGIIFADEIRSSGVSRKPSCVGLVRQTSRALCPHLSNCTQPWRYVFPSSCRVIHPEKIPDLEKGVPGTYRTQRNHSRGQF